MYIVPIGVKENTLLLSFRPGRTAALSPPIPPNVDQFRSNKDSGHATRLVTKQQPDKALHLTSLQASSLCSCIGVQAFNNKANQLDHVTLPHELPHGVRCSQELLILPSQ